MIRYVCDVCGIIIDSDRGIKGELIRPKSITIRVDDEGEKHACSEKCLKKITNQKNEKDVQ